MNIDALAITSIEPPFEPAGFDLNEVFGDDHAAVYKRYQELYPEPMKVIVGTNHEIHDR